ncbi:SRPBCC family protein [Actinomadura atramentaria]|uniref:SRPBCC family protein n=1 Tax=Actinomadura atramentaria TaxID=1990 RepID=UPI00036D34D0|nr:SRPBCC family protein [Actinomadura atramentaria]
MQLDHEFTVPIPVDRAWSVLRDVPALVPSVPGATLDSIDGGAYAGRLRVKAGPITVTFRGTIRVAVADPDARTFTVEAEGREARGPGAAAATLHGTLAEDDGATRVSVRTDLRVTGRLTEAGSDALAGVVARLIARFAKNLTADLASRPADDTGVVPDAEPETGSALETGPAHDGVTASASESTPGIHAVPEPGIAAEPKIVPEPEGTEPPPIPEIRVPVEEITPKPISDPFPDPAADVGTVTPLIPRQRSTGPDDLPTLLSTVVPLRPATHHDDAASLPLPEPTAPSLTRRAAPALAALLALLVTIRLVRRHRS